MFTYKPGSSLSRTQNPQVSCATPGVSSLERVRFFPRQLLTPDDLMQEQEYFRAKMRRHNRMLHGWGVVCGCEVVASAEDWTVCVSPGYLLGPQGDEIVIDDCVKVDLSLQDVDGNALAGCSDAVDPWCSSVKGNLKTGTTVYLAAAYSECYSRPVRVQSAGCGCDDDGGCEYSRIRDSYVLRVLTSLPASYDDILKPPNGSTILRCPPEGVRQCPECVDEPWVILAAITIKGKTISQDDIDNRTYRRYVASFGSFFFTCRDEEDVPTTPTPTPATFMRVNRVSMLNPNNETVEEMKPGDYPWNNPNISDHTPWKMFIANNNSGTIEVEFTDAPLDYDSVVSGVTFIVQRASGEILQGRIVRMPNNTVRWVMDPNNDAFNWQLLTVRLVGGASNTQQTIRSSNGTRLDGNVTSQLPSGDGAQGGDFVFTLQYFGLT